MTRWWSSTRFGRTPKASRPRAAPPTRSWRNLAVNQTFIRSINTSVVGVLPVASLLVVGAFILGAGTLRDIALTLFIGMIAGTCPRSSWPPPFWWICAHARSASRSTTPRWTRLDSSAVRRPATTSRSWLRSMRPQPPHPSPLATTSVWRLSPRGRRSADDHLRGPLRDGSRVSDQAGHEPPAGDP